MDSFFATFQFQNEEKSLELPDTYQEFLHLIKTQFNVMQFETEVVFADSEMKLISEKDYRQLRKNANLKIRKIIIRQLKKHEVESMEFYDYFLHNKELECCLKKTCPLCEGNGQAQIEEKDKILINKLIKQRITERMEEIEGILFKRYKLKLKTPEEFLNYHKCQQQQVKQQEQDFAKQFQKIKFYKARLTGPTYEILTWPQKENIIEIQMQNDGDEDWPPQVFFKCFSGHFQINEKVKSLKVGEQKTQKIKIYVPKIESNNYSLECSLAYHLNDCQHYFGERIILIISVEKERVQQQVTPQGFDEDFEEQNKKLIPELRSTLEQMGFEEQEIDEALKNALVKFKNRCLTTSNFFEECI